MKFNNLEWKEDDRVKQFVTRTELGTFIRMIQWENVPYEERAVIVDDRIIETWQRVIPNLMGRTVEEVMETGFRGTREEAEEYIEEQRDPEWERTWSEEEP